jgi:DNA-directed RNA polymerase subunit RPC12/RpoP
MSTGKIVGYIVAAILIFFGVLLVWSAFSPEATSPGGQLVGGIALAALGLGIVVAIRLREPKPKQEVVIKQQIDIGGDVEMESLKCKNCGAQLDKGAIGTVEGAVVVNCPYCGATYQIVEEPKW